MCPLPLAVTNFAINKHHEDFEIGEDGDEGHKRSLGSLVRWMDANGHSWADAWGRIKERSL